MELVELACHTTVIRLLIDQTLETDYPRFDNLALQIICTWGCLPDLQFRGLLRSSRVQIPTR